MNDWKDNVLFLNSMTAKMMAPFVPLVPIDRNDLVLIEKTVLQSQLQLLQGLEQLIQNRIDQIKAEPGGPTEKAQKIKLT
jgi:hypothetical protein